MKTKKTSTEKLVEKFAIKFVKGHFSEIDFNRVDWEVLNLEDAIKQIKNDSELADYIISEVMAWGTPTDYLEKITVASNYNRNVYDGVIVKISNKYFCINDDSIYEVEEKKEEIFVKQTIYVPK